MKYLILFVLFLLAACGSGGGGDQLANISASDSANVAVTFGNSEEVDQDISNVTQNCLACCDGDELDSECIGSLDVSCAPEDFNNTECQGS